MPPPRQVLADAFSDDAMFTFIEPDADRRRRVLPWFFGVAERLGRQQGRVQVDPGRAAAIWLLPGRTALGPAALVRSGLVLAPLRLGPRAFRRFTALTGAFEEAGAAVHGPRYWHLFILGVAPPHQGRGAGAALIRPVLAEADRAGDVCYLETTEERNLGFYRRHGFEVASVHSGGGLPDFWTMLRPPSQRS